MDKPAIKAGALITCENGHIVAEALEDVRRGDLNYSRKIGNWRIFEVPQAGDPDPRCGCGAQFWSNKHGYHLESGWEY